MDLCYLGFRKAFVSVNRRSLINKLQNTAGLDTVNCRVSRTSACRWRCGGHEEKGYSIVPRKEQRSSLILSGLNQLDGSPQSLVVDDLMRMSHSGAAGISNT